MKDTLEIQPEEFEALMFNVSVLGPEVSIINHFERLKIVPEFHLEIPSNLSKNMIMRYIVFMYDKNSPYRKRFPDITRRKRHCGIAAGFLTTEEGVIKAHYQKTVMDNPIPQVIQMIIEFVRINSSPKFTHMVVLEEMYYQRTARVFGGEDVKVTELKDIQAELVTVFDDLFAGEVNKVVKAQVNEILQFKKIDLRPEDIASLLQSNRKFSAQEYLTN